MCLCVLGTVYVSVLLIARGKTLFPILAVVVAPQSPQEEEKLGLLNTGAAVEGSA